MRNVFCLTLGSIAPPLGRSTKRTREIHGCSSRVPTQNRIVDLPVLACQQVEEQAIVRLAVDAMALPLAADKAKAHTLDGAQRWVAFDHPGVDAKKAHVAKSVRQHERSGDRARSPVAQRL